jgi:hypothetical protein
LITSTGIKNTKPDKMQFTERILLWLCRHAAALADFPPDGQADAYASKQGPFLADCIPVDVAER